MMMHYCLRYPCGDTRKDEGEHAPVLFRCTSWAFQTVYTWRIYSRYNERLYIWHYRYVIYTWGETWKSDLLRKKMKSVYMLQKLSLFFWIQRLQAYAAPSCWPRSSYRLVLRGIKTPRPFKVGEVVGAWWISPSWANKPAGEWERRSTYVSFLQAGSSSNE